MTVVCIIIHNYVVILDVVCASHAVVGGSMSRGERSKRVIDSFARVCVCLKREKDDGGLLKRLRYILLLG